MLKMNQKEMENWKKNREQGATKYALKTSSISTLFVFLLYFVAEGLMHLDKINEYLSRVSNAMFIYYVPTLIITFIALFICSYVLFRITEKRYNETIKETSTNA